MDIRQFERSTNESGNMRWYGGSSQMNPYWMSEYNMNQDNRDRFIMYASLSHQFTDWLSGEITAGSDMYTTSTDKRMFAGGPIAPNGQFSMSKETFFENNFSYLLSASQDNIIDRLGIAANFGGNVMMQEWEGMNSSAGQLEVPNLFALNNSTSNPTVGEWLGQKRILSLYGTLQFNWDDYFFVEGTLRNDWASTLSPENRSFMYPSFSVSYVFTEMMERMNTNVPSWFTFGRLRASIAQVGNALDPYHLYNTYSIGNDPLGVTTANIGGTLFNPDVQSELITSNELGADLRFFSNRLAFDFTWYQTNATNQLIAIPMDPLSGFNSRMINAGNIENKGIEFMINGSILESREGLRWNAQFNYSTNTNRII
jgi:outer membrane receptor protein involved in Fe transport